MKVTDLISVLQEISSENPDAVVLGQTDQEGNGYTFIRGAEVVGYREDCYEVKVGYLALNEELIGHGFTDEDIITDNIGCVIFP